MSAPPATSSSSSGSHPSVTESKGKLCSACSAQLSKSSFSNKQWLEPAAQRRCINCIAANTPSKAAAAASSPAPSTASATPTPTTSLPPPPATSSAVPLKAKKASAAPVIRPSPVRENSVLSNKPHSARPVKKNPKRPTLLDDEGDWFLPGPEAALSEIFDRFDVDHDEQWSIKETQSFAVATNGKAFTTEELYEVTQHFFKDSKLPKQGFLQFYHLQTSSHPAETWKDLQKLGYGWDMQLTTATAKASPTPVEPPPASSSPAEQSG